MNSRIGKWGASHDGSIFTGDFDSREEAIDELIDMVTEIGYIGVYRAPEAPENIIAEYDLLSVVELHDDYNNEFSEVISPTKEQQDELQTDIRRIVGEWFDRHELRPSHFIVDEIETIHLSEHFDDQHDNL